MWRSYSVLENGGTLESVRDCYKNQEMCDKAVDNCLHVLEFVSECYKTQKMRDKVCQCLSFYNKICS